MRLIILVLLLLACRAEMKTEHRATVGSDDCFREGPDGELLYPTTEEQRLCVDQFMECTNAAKKSKPNTDTNPE